MKKKYLFFFSIIILISGCFLKKNSFIEHQPDLRIEPWLVCGPFPNTPSDAGKPSGWQTDFLIDHGGEFKISPHEGLKHKFSGEVRTWKKTNFIKGRFFLDKYFSVDGVFLENVVAYAWTTIKSFEEQEVLFLVGSDDGIKIWINGELIHKNFVRRGFKEAQDRFSAQLKKGVNTILVKVDQEGGGWSFGLETVFRYREIFYDRSRKKIAVKVEAPLKTTGTNLKVITSHSTVGEAIFEKKQNPLRAVAKCWLEYFDGNDIWLKEGVNKEKVNIKKEKELKDFVLKVAGDRLPATSSDCKWAKRNFYNAKYELRDQVLHGAGQCEKSFDKYIQTVGGETEWPVLYMTYTGVKADFEKQERLINRWSVFLEEYLNKNSKSLNLQIGLSMTTDGNPEESYEDKVAAGEYDQHLKNLANLLKTKIKSPMYIRVGYEFNGWWNGYKPQAYKEAFRRVVEIFRRENVPAAYVWCAYPVKADLSYYPGDDVVDWWGMDLFDKEDLDRFETMEFLQKAHQHGKPVMIGESTPRFVGVLDGKESWQSWFVKYFGLIKSQPGIKAFCYINWDWSRYEMWHNWGDARLEMNEYVAQKYREEIQQTLYKNSSLEPVF
jgi:hypothetical protein